MSRDIPTSRQKRNTIVIGDGQPLPLTADALRRLQEKHDSLKKALPNLIAETARTAAYGDRSENFEYQQAKGTLRRTQIQLMTLEDQLNRAVVIPENKNISGVVGLGSTVTIESKEKGKAIFQILGSHETNPSQGKISNKSPLGAALLNRKIGDAVTVKVADKLQTYLILEIR